MITIENSYTKKNLNTFKSAANKYFGNTFMGVMKTIFGNKKCVKPSLQHIEDVVKKVLMEYVSKGYNIPETIFELNIFDSDVEKAMGDKTIAVCCGYEKIGYSLKVMAYKFHECFYNLTDERIKYETLVVIGHERRHAQQDDLFRNLTHLDRSNKKYSNQLHEIDAEAAGHKFAQEVMGIC